MTNKATFLKTLVAAAFCTAAVACSRDGADLAGNEDGPAQGRGTVITAEAVLGKTEQEMAGNAKQTAQAATRTDVTPDGNGGLVYNWEVGKTIPLYVYITDGTRHEALTPVDLNIVSADKAKFTFTVPEDYDLANLKVAAATGKESGAPNGAWAAGMDDDGTVTVGTPDSVDAASNNYNIPLYAGLTPVSPGGQSVYLKFSMLGSWIGVKAKSDVYYPSNIHSVALESDVLHMDGKLDLSAETPAWTPGSYRIDIPGKETEDTIMVIGAAIGGNERGEGTTQYSKPFYVWAKADVSKASTKKARVYVRDEIGAKEGPLYAQANRYSNRNKFYREAKQVVQFADGDTYNFGVDANLRDADGGLIITEYYHSTLAVGEYNWIEITNTTNETVSLEDYYLVSIDCDNQRELYVVELKDLQRLDWRKRGVAFPENSTTEIPAGRSICLAAGQVNSGWTAVKKNGSAYQMVNTESGTGNISAVSGGIRLPKFLCKGGYNIDFNDPDNNIVDNLGVRLVYDPGAGKFLTYAYYMGAIVFFRTKGTGAGFPLKAFRPEAWCFRTLTWSYLGAYNDRADNFSPLSGYAGDGKVSNFAPYDVTMASFTTRHFRPDEKHPSPI